MAEQADMVATAWSPPGAPASWRLTALQFGLLRDDPELLGLAASIPADRLPPLLFTAAVTSLVLALEPQPLRESFPRLGQPQTPPAADFAAAYRSFCLDHRERVLELCAGHRYQMNEVARCADFVVPLAAATGAERELTLVDIGTGAGLALHFDRYRYRFVSPGGNVRTVGPSDSPMTLDVQLRGDLAPRVPERLPRVIDRVGIDVEPLDLTEAAVLNWLTACVPQELGAVTRFHQAAEVALSHPAQTVRGDACDVLPGVLDSLDAGALVCLVDSYVNVFFADEQLERFRAIVDDFGRRRDLDWVSTDPLVPMGPQATSTVTGLPAPAELLERNRAGGVFGTVSQVSYRDGRATRRILGTAHPSALWLEWLDPASAVGRADSHTEALEEHNGE